MKKLNCIVTEGETIKYLVSSYIGPDEEFDDLKSAKAAYRDNKKVYGMGDLRKITVKTITIENEESIAR